MGGGISDALHLGAELKISIEKPTGDKPGPSSCPRIEEKKKKPKDFQTNQKKVKKPFNPRAQKGEMAVSVRKRGKPNCRWG